MPNWVTNVITFSNEEDTRKVAQGMIWHNKRFSFKSILPHPATKEECEACYIIRNIDEFCTGTPKKPWFNWHSWNIHHWGCKWDCSNVYWLETSIYFKTPWNSPDDDLLQKIADKFNVTFKIEAWDEGENKKEPSNVFQTRTFKPAE